MNLKRISVDRQEELKNCTFVKTVLMVLVVFYHSILFWNGTWFTADPVLSAPMLPIISGWLNTVHIQGFTLVSGYLFSYLKYEKRQYSEFLPFVKNKAMRLLVPYLFAAIAWVIPASFPFYRYDGATLLKNFLWAQNPSQLWFLVMLFGVFVIFWLLSDFFYDQNLLGAVTVVGLYCCSLVGIRCIPNYFRIWTALRYLPVFWLGFKLRQYGTATVRKIPVFLWVAASLFLFALMRYLDSRSSTICQLLAAGVTFAANVIGALMSFVVLQKLAEKVKWNNRYFNFVSKRSMAVYLFHQQIIYFVIVGLNGFLNPYLHAILNFVVAMAVSLLLATVLLRFRLTRFLLGEK